MPLAARCGLRPGSSEVQRVKGELFRGLRRPAGRRRSGPLTPRDAGWRQLTAEGLGLGLEQKVLQPEAHGFAPAPQLPRREAAHDGHHGALSGRSSDGVPPGCSAGGVEVLLGALQGPHQDHGVQALEVQAADGLAPADEHLPRRRSGAGGGTGGRRHRGLHSRGGRAELEANGRQLPAEAVEVLPEAPAPLRLPPALRQDHKAAARREAPDDLHDGRHRALRHRTIPLDEVFHDQDCVPQAGGQHAVLQRAGTRQGGVQALRGPHRFTSLRAALHTDHTLRTCAHKGEARTSRLLEQAQGHSVH
mmetsp:Transcript_93952/g.292546  ORF Transcript_93952/g.292546 Transcript_93952/m.292546 type:complete len:305 (-) Transcript_93952:670-1584(-)